MVMSHGDRVFLLQETEKNESMKTKLLLIGILYSMISYGQVPTTGLVAEYLFTGASLNDTGGAANLSLTGSLITAEPNRAGGANHAVSLNGDHLTRSGTTGNTISISFWIKTTTNDAVKRVIIDQSERISAAETSTQTGWYAYLKNGKVGVAGNFEWHRDGNTIPGVAGYSGYNSTEASVIISDGNWHHIVITMIPFAGSWWNGPYARWDKIVRNTYQIYTDGVSRIMYEQVVNLGTVINPSLRRFINSAVPITIANSRNLNSTDRYASNIDDIRYYSRTLTPVEVTALATEVGVSTPATITKTNQTITFSALPAKTMADANFNLTATTSSGLAISYASSNPAVATVSGNTVTLVSVGSTNITASQGGNISFNPATDIPNTLIVNQASQTINFVGPTIRVFGDPDFSLTATATSALAVSFASSNSSVATISGSTITVVGAGNTFITASQSGNANFSAATSIQRTFTVNKASQVITFNALVTKTLGDANFNLNATTTSGLAISYASSNTSVATVSGNDVTIVGAGTTTITASQGGDANYNAATQVGRTMTVNKAAQSITFNALVSKTVGDANFTLPLNASSGLVISYQSSNTSVATIVGNTVTIVAPGSTTITATQVGNANYFAASQVQQSLTVNKANQTITFAALPAKTFGDVNVNLTATSTSSLPVSYISSNTAVATVSGSDVTIVGAGTTTISASQAGNVNYNVAVNIDQILNVVKANQSIAFGALSDKTFDDTAFNVTATSTSVLPINYVSSNLGVATVTGSTITIVGVGTTTITASQPGNVNYNAASDVQQTLTVNKANQTITFSPLADKTVGDAAFNLSATASSGLTVSYASSNTSVATVTGNTVTLLGLGSTIITASQGGNANFNPGIDHQQSLSVKESQTITFAVLPAKTFGDAAFTLTATTSSGLAISYVSSNTAVATVVGNTVTIAGAGTTTITASQSGNANYHAALDAARSLDISKANNAITFNALGDKAVGDAAFVLSATATSGLAPSFSTTSTKISIAGSQVTIAGAGRATITAAQASNTNYNAATSVERSFCIKPAKPTITLSNSNTESPALTSSASAGNQWFLNGVAIAGATNTTLSITQIGTYKVKVQVDDCVSDFSNDQVFVVTGDIQNNAGTINIYPNPVADWLTVTLGNSVAQKEVAIYQLAGKRIASQHVSTEEARFYVADYTQGIYVVRITTADAVRVIRFIKQ